VTGVQTCALPISVREAAAQLRPHVWFAPEWEEAVPAAIVAHPSRSELLQELVPPGLVEHLAQDPSRRHAARETDRLLLRLAAVSDPADWQQTAAGQIHADRIRFATAWPQQVGATRQWAASNPQVVMALLAAIRRVQPNTAAVLGRAVANLRPEDALRQRALSMTHAALME